MSTAEQLDALVPNFTDLGGFLDALLEIAPNLDEEQCVEVRSQLADLADQVKGAIGTVDQRLLAVLTPGQTVQVPGAGAVTINRTGKKTTKGSTLARRLAARVADTPCNEDGEPIPPGVLCEKVADEITAVFGLDNSSATFRSGELKKRNMRESEFTDWTDGDPRVVFVR